jgi:hypothetical protein
VAPDFLNASGFTSCLRQINTAIRSKLRFRKNMPFFGSVRYLFLRRKSATKDYEPHSQTLLNNKTSNFSIYIFFFFEPRLEICRSKVDTQTKRRRCKKIHSRSKSLGPLRFSILCFHERRTKAPRRRSS